MASETRPVALVVDDQLVGQQVLAALVEAEGYLPLVASGGLEALALLETDAPDVVLLDLMMPGMDGYEVLARIRSNPHTADTVVIIVSAESHRASMLRALEEGADDFLGKPIDREELQLKLRLTMRLRRYRRRLAKQARHEAILQLSPDGILSLRARDGVILEANQAFLGLVRAGLEAVEGQPFAAFLPASQGYLLPVLLGHGDGAVGDGGAAIRGLSAELQPRDGSATFAVELDAMPLRWHDEDQVLLVVRDVRARRALERESARLAAADAVALWSAAIGHDLNNAINVIGLSSEMLAGDAGLPASMQADVAAVVSGVQHARKLIERLRSVARTGSGTGTPVEVSPDKVLEDLGWMLRNVAPAHEVRIEASTAAWLIHADRTQLERAIVNLVLNAANASEPGQPITVRTFVVAPDAPLPDPVRRGTRPPEMPLLALQVEDAGSGMSEEVLERVLEPFFTTRAGTGGTGLGLPVVASLAMESGGLLGIRSAPGAGTSISICLPATPLVAEASRRAATIALIEPDLPHRTALADGLEALGFACLALADGRELLQRLGQGGVRIDALVFAPTADSLGPEGYVARVRGFFPAVHLLAMQANDRRIPLELQASLGLSGTVSTADKPATIAALLTRLLHARER